MPADSQTSHHNAFIVNKSFPVEYQEALAEESLREKKLHQNKSRKVLLIGGAGYIGSVVTAELLRQNYQIRCLDALLYENQHCILPYWNHPNYEFQHGDFTHLSDLQKALIDITDVIVLAGLVGDPITKKYPEFSDHINNFGMSQLINELHHHLLNKVIFVSTCSNYGLMSEGVLANEASPLKPLSLYAKAKVAMEEQVLALKNKVNYCPTILRFATAFGLSPRMRFDLTINEFVKELYFGKALIVYDADTWRPYCHVLDFAEVLRRVLEAPKERVAFEVFNAGGDQNNYTKQGIIETIQTFLPNTNILYQQHGSDPRNYKVNFEKIQTQLYFTPRYLVTDGIKEILQALKNNLFHETAISPNNYGNYQLEYIISKPNAYDNLSA